MASPVFGKENRTRIVALEQNGGTVNDKIYDDTGHLTIDCNPGGANPVNYLIVNSAIAGASIVIQPAGTSADIGVEIAPKGTGSLTVNSTPVALSSAAVIPDSTAVLLSTLVAEFNALLAALRDCGITVAS